MPMLMTDVAEGQKAALNMQVAPIIAREQMEQAPMETMKLQQSLERGQLDNEKIKMEAQILLRSTAQDERAKAKLSELFKDPSIRALPEHDQMARAGRVLLEEGMLEKGRQFSDLAQKSRENYYQGQELASKTKERQLEHARNVISNITFENIDTALIDLQSSGNASPEETRRFGEVLTQARIQGPEAFEAVKTQLTKQLGSLEANQQRRVAETAAVKAENDKRREDNKHTEQILQGNRQIAAIQAGIEREGIRANVRIAGEVRRELEGIERSYQTELRDTTTRVNGELRILSTNEKDLKENSLKTTRILQGFIKDFGIPKKPNWASTDKDDRNYTRYTELKEDEEDAKRAIDLKDPTSKLSVIQTRVAEARKELDDVKRRKPNSSTASTAIDPTAPPTSTTTADKKTLTNEVIAAIRERPRTPNNDALISKEYGSGALSLIYPPTPTQTTGTPRATTVTPVPVDVPGPSAEEYVSVGQISPYEIPSQLRENVTRAVKNVRDKGNRPKDIAQLQQYFDNLVGAGKIIVGPPLVGPPRYRDFKAQEDLDATAAERRAQTGNAPSLDSRPLSPAERRVTSMQQSAVLREREAARLRLQYNNQMGK